MLGKTEPTPNCKVQIISTNNNNNNNTLIDVLYQCQIFLACIISLTLRLAERERERKSERKILMPTVLAFNGLYTYY